MDRRLGPLNGYIVIDGEYQPDACTTDCTYHEYTQRSKYIDIDKIERFLKGIYVEIDQDFYDLEVGGCWPPDNIELYTQQVDWCHKRRQVCIGIRCNEERVDGILPWHCISEVSEEQVRLMKLHQYIDRYYTHEDFMCCYDNISIRKAVENFEPVDIFQE